MIEDLRLRNFSKRTIDTYVGRVARFAKHFERSPDGLGPEEVWTFLVFLLHHGYSKSELKITAAALRFFYPVTLGKDWPARRIPYPKRERRLPVVLSRKEVSSFIRSIGCLKVRTILTTMFAGVAPLSPGLRQWTSGSRTSSSGSPRCVRRPSCSRTVYGSSPRNGNPYHSTQPQNHQESKLNPEQA